MNTTTCTNRHARQRPAIFALTTLALLAAPLSASAPVQTTPAPVLVVQPPAAPNGPLASIPVPDLAARLAALSPAKPIDYFLLAEEIAQEPHERDARALARNLYALAFELARAAGDARLASSSALGLTELTTRADQRRWLRAIAAIVAPQAITGALSAGGPADVAAQAARQLAAIDNADEGEQQRIALDLVTAMGLARAGEGRRAATFLAKPGVKDLLRQYEGVLTEGGLADAEATIQAWIDRWPKCRTCENRRVLRRGDNSRLCTECNGVPGPRLPVEALIAQYRAESMFLRGVQRSFAAQTLADRGEPLRDPDPAQLCNRLGIDPTLTIFRKGAWTKP